MTADPPPDDAEDLFDAAPCGYVILGPDGAILRANRTFADWIGHSREGLAGRRFQDLLTVGSRVFHDTHVVPLLRMQGSASEIAADLLNASGKRLPVLLSATQQSDAGGAPRTIRVAVFNATDRRRYEEELRQERMAAEQALDLAVEEERARAMMVAGLSHELRTPLNAIIGFSDMIRLQMRGPSGVKDYVDYAGIIHSSGKHLLSLVNDLLALGEVENTRSAPDLQSVDAAAMVAEAMRLLEVLAEKRKIRLTSDVAPNADLWTDQRGIRQILANLISNAIKYSPTGSEVVISARPEETMFRFEVRDAGMGMKSDDIRRLGTPFFRAGQGSSSEGSGLGFVIVKRLTERLRGRLEVESEPEKGTRVAVVLPRFPSPG